MGKVVFISHFLILKIYLERSGNMLCLESGNLYPVWLALTVAEISVNWKIMSRYPASLTAVNVNFAL